MSNAKPNLTYRQRQALATQKLIVDSARDLFLEQGYGNTTIEAISARAGVAVSTVYAVFGNKRGILRAIREAWHQESRQRDIYQEARQQSDPRRRLELAARATRRQWETGAAMLTIYRGAAAIDQEAAAELKEALRGRRASLDHFIDEMPQALRSGLGPDRAAAIFFALTLPEVYESLVHEAGWSPDQYEAWLAEILLQQLLP
jgi:AcrR family transcriptional regulator